MFMIYRPSYTSLNISTFLRGAHDTDIVKTRKPDISYGIENKFQCDTSGKAEIRPPKFSILPKTYILLFTNCTF